MMTFLHVDICSEKIPHILNALISALYVLIGQPVRTA